MEKELVMEKNTLWIVSELFYPEESATAFILTNIAIKLKEKYIVNVITGNPIYETVKENDGKLLDGINLFRVDGQLINKNNIISRLKRAMLLTFKFSSFLKKNAHKNDKVLAVTNPAFNILNISKVCQKKKLNLIILAHDIFPENSIAAGIFKNKGFLYNVVLRKFNNAYERANSIVAIGNDMKAILETKIKKNTNVNIKYIPNWANTDVLQYMKYNQKKKIVIKFAGNIGRVQGIDNLVEIISRIKNPNVKFVFQGAGACKNLVQNKECINIFYKEPYNRSEEQDAIAECTIGLISLASDMYGLGVPSKTYNLLACGRPILFIGPKDSEVYNLVKMNDVGWAFDINEEEKIISFLENLTLDDFTQFEKKCKMARELAEQYFSKEEILNKFFEEI